MSSLTTTFIADMTAIVTPKPGAVGVGNGTSVKVFPTDGRAPYFAALRQPPTWGVAAGGYGPATISCARTGGDTAAHLLYADVEIWGKHGPCYFGRVKETERDGTLHCMGPHENTDKFAMGKRTGITNIDTAVADCFDTTMPAWARPSTLAWMQTDAGTATITTRDTPAQSIAAHLQEVMQYRDWVYGWYFELLTNGEWESVPHYAPAPTVPAYIVTLSAEDASAFMGDSLEGKLSRSLVEWGASATLEDVIDTDPAHYLVTIGRNIDVLTSAPNTMSATDANRIALASIGKKSQTKAGQTRIKRLTKAATHGAALRRQHAGVRSRARAGFGLGYGESGKSATSRIQLASGLEVYAPDIRHGEMVRVVIPTQGYVDLRLAGAEFVGDSQVSLDLGADSGRLEALLSRVS
jgi:hypothetical protein